ncbi:uncharacterized protein LOC131008890 [Salvia miltiorrhiza]|uniref:uncharacterized protein LOC131008890 n=1 Tax=Salvia miltiorrhiza TaxID=226208 RepID=UPI0025AD2B3D|nr:uncharacterized protein LOC131008890 [Salvia miltiorrhiza]
MAKEGRGFGKKDSSLMFREISPPHKWDQDLHSHYLRLTLPGFANADITLHIDKYGHLVVRGSHQITEHKYVSFEETFDVADDADLEQAEGLFQDEQIYCVAIPKSNKLGQRNEDGVKFDDRDHNKDKKSESMPNKYGVRTMPNDPSRPSSLIRTHKSMRKIVFLIAILVAIYAAWLNREPNN